jgi:hypothetical protein
MVKINNLDYKCNECEWFIIKKCPGRNYSARPCLYEKRKKREDDKI